MSGGAMPSTAEDNLRQAMAAYQRRGLKLDMSRGKPSPEQLDLCAGINTAIGAGDLVSPGLDARNYGHPQGLESLRRMFRDVLQVPPAQIVAANNSSLALMHDCLVFALLKGFAPHTPWASGKTPAFLCPVPGYDRHFALCEHYGIRLIAVPLTGRGPRMDVVEDLVRDPAVKGMWCVPVYSNPTGEIYDADTVARLAGMTTGAEDFRLFWDVAYASHHITDRRHGVAGIVERCAEAGHPDRPLVFASTSKMTYAGAGVAFLGASTANIHWYLSHAGKRSIGPDKINHLRHAAFFERYDMDALMAAHRAIIAPKFALVLKILAERLAGTGIAEWSHPEGGYFISFDLLKGSARRLVELAGEMGLALTPAGATYPYGVDPADRNIRLAPTFPTSDELRDASEIIALAARLAVFEGRDTL